jgi:rhomboid protease GluP
MNKPPSIVPSNSSQNPQSSQPYKISVQLAARIPWVTYTLIGLSVVVFLLQLLSQNLLGNDLLAAYGAKINVNILAGEYWRLFTPIFLHASIVHIAFNMYALYVLGPGLEQHYGPGPFLGLYLVSGFAGNVISYWMAPNPSLGASTAIFGLVAAEAVFVYQNRFMFGGRARQILVNLLTIVAINFVIGLSPGIDNWGHLGGLIGGLAFAWLGGPVYQVTGIMPDLKLVNMRSKTQTLMVGILVFLVFAFLAIFKGLIS